ncbi:hypothetical protein PO124_20530 [Bacillus licheniformis]|nr:hypothetical protein [Bacillus licheniformis]
MMIKSDQSPVRNSSRVRSRAVEKQLDQVAKDIGIEQLTGSKVSAVLEKRGWRQLHQARPKPLHRKLKEGKNRDLSNLKPNHPASRH